MGRKIVKELNFIEDGPFEIIAEASDKVGKLDEKEELKVIGKPVSRIDGYDKVSGTAKYTFDISLPNMLYAATLRSPYPHAKIISIDTSKAEKMPGVKGVLTYKNSPKIPWYNGSTYLFDTHLRYAGDEIACVAAISQKIAEEALKLINVQYEKLNFVLDAKEALKKDSVKLYKQGNLYRGKVDIYKRGDVKKGFKEADITLNEIFKTQVEVHNPAEVHCSVVNWDGNKLTVYDSTQAVFSVRDAIAQSLNIPSSRVRVIKKYMGGGFGSKLEAGKYTIMAALLAKETGKPVKITLNRKEMNTSVGNRPESEQTLSIGVKKSGEITALSHHFIGGTGAHARGAGCSWPVRTLYKSPNVYVEESSVFVNTVRNRAFRAPGHVQNIFALESLMDMTAEKLGIDPIEFRLKNYAEIDQVFNLKYTSKGLKDAYLKGAEAINWKKRKQPGQNKGRIKRGIGMASQIWWGGGTIPAYATLKLNKDGSAQVLSGTQDIGTGTYTFIAQIVSEELHIPLEKISVILGDTAVCPVAPLSGGSLTAPSVSPAVLEAAQLMKAKLISGASAVLNISENKLYYEKGLVYSREDKTKKISISSLFSKMRESVLVTTGARNANPKGYIINTFGAHFAEVEVDTLSGRVKVLKVAAAHDIGRVLNPKTMKNQIHGGITMGIGFALTEQRELCKNSGIVLNPNLHDYKIPTLMDIPEIEIIIVSKADKLISGTGVKGVGEPAMIPTAGAIANAVYNALGVRIKSLPITPDKVLEALSIKH